MEVDREQEREVREVTDQRAGGRQERDRMRESEPLRVPRTARNRQCVNWRQENNYPVWNNGGWRRQPLSTPSQNPGILSPARWAVSCHPWRPRPHSLPSVDITWSLGGGCLTCLPCLLLCSPHRSGDTWSQVCCWHPPPREPSLRSSQDSPTAPHIVLASEGIPLLSLHHPPPGGCAVSPNPPFRQTPPLPRGPSPEARAEPGVLTPP